MQKKTAMKKVSMHFEGVKGNIIYHSFKGIPTKTLLLSFNKSRRVLSTNLGYKEVNFVGNHYNPEELWEMLPEEQPEYQEWLFNSTGVDKNNAVFLSTGVDIDNAAICHKVYEDFRVCSIVTAGVVSNAQRMGSDEGNWIEADDNFVPAGTINIILITNVDLHDGAMARAIITGTEAKTAALQDLDIRSSFTPLVNQATGTGTDNMVVVSGSGAKIKHVGGHTKIGELIARAVKEGVTAAIAKQNGITRNQGFEERLNRRGVDISGLPGKYLLTEFSKDVNISALFLAALYLEEVTRKGLFPCATKKDGTDKCAVARMLGETLSKYVSAKRIKLDKNEISSFNEQVNGYPQFIREVLRGMLIG